MQQHNRIKPHKNWWNIKWAFSPFQVIQHSCWTGFLLVWFAICLVYIIYSYKQTTNNKKKLLVNKKDIFSNMFSEVDR